MSSKSSPSDPRRFSRRSKCLILLFFGAIAMGSGPGVFLVNGKGPIAGLPSIYFWLVCWWIAQVSVVVIAYRTVWRKK